MINEKKEAISSFVVYFGVKNNEKINRELILPFIQKFFKARKIENYEAIQGNSEISDLDFKKVEFSYFYDVILNEIIRNKKKEVVCPVKFIITLDKENCSKKCEKTGICYDEILLNKEPVFYFIYMNIEDIFSFLRRQ